MHDGLYHDIVINSDHGRPFIGNLGVRLLEVDGHSAHLLMMQDVTLQKKLQREIINKQSEIKGAFEELLKQNRQLRELDLAKDRFIALTTHELRTPLSAMVSSAEILKMGLYDSPEQMREFIDMIHDQGLHLQDLVNDILDFAKIQAGKMDFYIEEQDPLPLVKSILRNFEGMAETYKVTLQIDAPPVPQLCYFDDLRLRQILSNIVNNAIKYNRPGGTVRVSFEGFGDHVRILVKDTGKGIPEEQYDKVFNEFETVGQVAEHHKGTGLGMPISRKLADGMGGKLMLESTVGVGSTFWVEIPNRKVLDPTLYRPRLEQVGDRAS
ncbi:MAG: HAMP domain-containing histidine kinase [Bdellovibrionaceae bacterium]|nr:HAMP domain-containing histidine kinase [Pseudobdellovibrionaceae bacterium]